MPADPTPRILHLFATFEEADPAARRTVQLVNALGSKAHHAIVADDRERRGATRLFSKGAAGGTAVSWPHFPPLKGSKLPGRLLKLAAAMRDYELICTYGPGALDAAFAHTLFADVHQLPPLVHHEFDTAGDALGGRGRAWYRRFALGRSAALIVPNRTLEHVALGAWDQPRARVRLIPDGIDTRAFAVPARRDLLPGLIKRKDERWLGIFADALGDDPSALLRALAQMPERWQLVVMGQSAQRAALETGAQELEIEDRLHFTTASPEERDGRAGLLALFDTLVLPAPVAGGRTLLFEAMAAGLPLVAPHGEDADAAVSSANGPLLFEPGDAEGLAHGLQLLATRDDERRRIGTANRARAREEFDTRRMVERSWALFAALIGRRSEGTRGEKG